MASFSQFTDSRSVHWRKLCCTLRPIALNAVRADVHEHEFAVDNAKHSNYMPRMDPLPALVFVYRTEDESLVANITTITQSLTFHPVFTTEIMFNVISLLVLSRHGEYHAYICNIYSFRTIIIDFVRKLNAKIP